MTDIAPERVTASEVAADELAEVKRKELDMLLRAKMLYQPMIDKAKGVPLEEDVQTCSPHEFEELWNTAEGIRFSHIRLGQPTTVGELRAITDNFVDSMELAVRNGPRPTLYLMRCFEEMYLEIEIPDCRPTNEKGTP